MSAVRKIWYAIYPTNDEHKSAALMWLPFMLWFFLDPYWRHAGPWRWTWNSIAGVFFVLVYMQGIARKGPGKIVCIGLMLAMTAIFLPINAGGIGLLIYTAAVIGFNPQLRWVVPLMVLDIAIFLAFAHQRHLDIGAWGSILMLLVLVGFGNHYWAQKACTAKKLQLANEEIEHLAKVAERERIARDLHDVLGHTLSLITLKSELARKLVDRDPERARQEMQDVESASRAALTDVREAIRGYRTEGIFAELARARAALETAGVAVECDTHPVPLSAEQESVLSLALREAVTNVVRHADARRCNVTLRRNESLCTLEVADDGRGASGPEGNGLRGMRERLEALGGSLRLLTSNGTRLIIDLPLA